MTTPSKYETSPEDIRFLRDHELRGAEMSKPTAEDERAAVVAWLRSEAQFDRNYAEQYGLSPITKLGLERALYYEQAAGMLERGEHIEGKD